MNFNSFTFLYFFVTVYAIYLASRFSLRVQNLTLLVASYVFYGWWDWRFLGLILLSTVVDFLAGKKIHESPEDGKKRWLALSVVTNLGLLFVFKYFNFFAESLTTLLHGFGLSVDEVTLNVVLPVGISFYTFQTLSYSIDIYRGKLNPTDSFLNFAVFVAFFPQLVAGPIERASRLLPQVCLPRKITAAQVHGGAFLIALGLFKKVVVADNLGQIADAVYENHDAFGTPDRLVATVAFMLQIYGDFAGYTDIARGISKLLGFELAENFRLPFFATNPSDFWQRWHISLSTWLRDYLYIPLGGNRGNTFSTCRNLMLTMLIGGLWHGAAWNFVLWGGFHGAILIGYRLAGSRSTSARNDANAESQSVAGSLPRRAIQLVASWSLMTALTIYGWMLFRATSLNQIVDMTTTFNAIVSPSTVKWCIQCVFLAAPLIVFEACQQWTGNMLFLLRKGVVTQALFFTVIGLYVLVFGSRTPSEFIYFQF